MSKPEIILLGGGGHCKSCIDVIEQEGRFNIAGIVEHTDALDRGPVLGYPVLGSDDDLPALREKHAYALVTVGQIKSPRVRIRLFEKLVELNFQLPIIVSPFAYVSPHAQVGVGTIVMHHALINAGVSVGKNCIINSKALLEHDAIIEDHCHIASGAVISGGARIEKETFFGANAMCKEYITVGAESIVGGGGNRYDGCQFKIHSEKEVKIGIFGASGFAREVLDLCIALRFEKIVFIEKISENGSYYGWPLIQEDEIERLIKEGYFFSIGIGDNHIRKNIFKKFKNLPYINLVHPTATIGYDMKGRLAKSKGNIITSGVRFTNNIQIGNFGIYNLNCTIGHDCMLDDFINVAPGANISGNVHIQECAYIGTNVSTIQGKSIDQKLAIGDNSVIGAGAVVTKSVPYCTTVIGNPAKPIIK